MNLDTLEHNPGTTPTASVIWMHGLGARYTDFLELLPMLGLPSVRFIFPQAPTRAVTINNHIEMPAWYDILEMSRTADRENCEQAQQSSRSIAALIDREQHRQIPPNRVVLAGFSQGAALTLHCGLQYPHTLAGLLVLSGYPVDEQTIRSNAHQANRNTPTYSGHGTLDEVVPLSEGERGRALLRELGPERPLITHNYPMGHELCGEQVRHIRQFLHSVLKD